MTDTKTIGRKKIIEKIAIKHRMHAVEVRAVIEEFLEQITAGLVKGDRFEFRGFGVFEVIERKAKVGRNPKDPDKAVPIPACNIAKFTPGKKLKKLVEAK